MLGFDGCNSVASKRQADGRIGCIRKSNKYVRKFGGISRLVVVQTACDGPDFSNEQRKWLVNERTS